MPSSIVQQVGLCGLFCTSLSICICVIHLTHMIPHLVQPQSVFPFLLFPLIHSWALFSYFPKHNLSTCLFHLKTLHFTIWKTPFCILYHILQYLFYFLLSLRFITTEEIIVMILKILTMVITNFTEGMSMNLEHHIRVVIRNRWKIYWGIKYWVN